MRCGYRDGDKAPMCYIEFIDRYWNENMNDTIEKESCECVGKWEITRKK